MKVSLTIQAFCRPPVLKSCHFQRRFDINTITTTLTYYTITTGPQQQQCISPPPPPFPSSASPSVPVPHHSTPVTSTPVSGSSASNHAATPAPSLSQLSSASGPTTTGYESHSPSSYNTISNKHADPGLHRSRGRSSPVHSTPPDRRLRGRPCQGCKSHQPPIHRRGPLHVEDPGS